ncbi:ABC transporter substrate-binding protein, partial [Christensenellaceae bacterium OttesenSCG-928-K19]|nr:ABC transporter substrate-binding protein [Christensenellaceae bacterium OttesenSCG-928-K19]
DVDAVLEEISGNSGKTALFLRASSTDVKAKADDNAACAILHDLGVDNIAAGDDSLLESLSMEAIIERDPDYIFAVMMGGDADAEATLQSMLMANPAWKDLSAVQNGNFEILPKELFHYKPNADWGRAYEYLYECIYQ